MKETVFDRVTVDLRTGDDRPVHRAAGFLHGHYATGPRERMARFRKWSAAAGLFAVCAAAPAVVSSCTSGRLAGRAPALLPEPAVSACSKEVTALLSRGPVVARVTTNGVTLMGRPVDTLLDTPVRITVTPEDGKPVTVESRYEKDRDSFHCRVEGLPANTLCRYTVSVGTNRVGPFHFATAPAAGDRAPFRFAVIGDTQNFGVWRSLGSKMAAWRPRFILHGGDLTWNSDVRDGWDPQFFGPARELLAHAPVFPALGNHDQSGKWVLDFFELPSPWYRAEYGSVQVLSLSCFRPCEPGSDQYEWLSRELHRPWNGWTILLLHAPPFSVMNLNPNVRWIENVLPLLLKTRVDLILCGHEHNYVRSRPIALERGQHGIVQVVTGGGGGPLYGYIKELPFIAAGRTSWHYLIVDVTKETLTGRAIAPEGDTIDSFVLRNNVPPPDLILAPRSATNSWQAAGP